jgi:hypothetical protein
MPIAKWLSVDIGYVSLKPDTCTGNKPALQKILEGKLLQDDIDAWVDPGETAISQSIGQTNDDWAAEVLQIELNRALAAAHAFKQAAGKPEQVLIEAEQLVCFLGSVSSLKPGILSGRPGTHCQLRGGIWVNTRSFRVLDLKQKPWLEAQLPQSMMFASLSWPCYKVQDSLRATATKRRT